MALCTASVLWRRTDGEAFVDQRYSRRHRLAFDGGAVWAGSSSPQVVPLPWSDAAAVDPEETFVASLASCHMLWFLSLAAARGFVVDRYEDAAVGLLGPDADGRTAMTRVTLRPAVAFAGALRPNDDEVDRLHDEAHGACFIARSVKAEVRCEAVRPAPDRPLSTASTSTAG